jgi:UDP-perosamine 4-acetyltransferase
VSAGTLILGGGGHAAGVIETLRLLHPDMELAICDSGLTSGSNVHGISVIGGDEVLGTASSRGYGAFAMGLGGVGDNGPRARLFERAISAGLRPLTLVHPSAVISASARLGDGSACLWGAIVAARATIGKNVIVNSGAIIEHDCRIGDHAHVASGATLAGTVQVAAFAHIGAGAVVRQGLSIGARAVVGAGAVVTKPVPEGVTVVGAPARIMERRS